MSSSCAGLGIEITPRHGAGGEDPRSPQKRPESGDPPAGERGGCDCHLALCLAAPRSPAPKHDLGLDCSSSGSPAPRRGGGPRRNSTPPPLLDLLRHSSLEKKASRGRDRCPLRPPCQLEERHREPWNRRPGPNRARP